MREFVSSLPGLEAGLPSLGETLSMTGPRNLLAKTVAAVAIALFWCLSTVGMTVGTAIGVTTLATAVNAITATPVEARRRHRGRGRRHRGRRRRGRGRGRGRGVCVGVGGVWICG